MNISRNNSFRTIILLGLITGYISAVNPNFIDQVIETTGANKGQPVEDKYQEAVG